MLFIHIIIHIFSANCFKMEKRFYIYLYLKNILNIINL